MTTRLVLLGAKYGPWAAINQIREPVLRVKGLSKGVVDAAIRVGDQLYYVGLSKDGDYQLTGGSTAFHPDVPGEIVDWIRLSASDPTPDLVCTVIPKKAA